MSTARARLDHARLQGRWHLTHTSDPCWLGVAKNVSVEFGRIAVTEKRISVSLDAHTSFSMRDGKRRTIPGWDTVDPKLPRVFRWRSKGGGICASRRTWQLVAHDRDWQWFAAWESKSPKSAGPTLSVYIRSQTLPLNMEDIIGEVLGTPEGKLMVGKLQPAIRQY